MGLILITHDLGVVAEVADRVVVMYAGDRMEQGPIEDIYYRSAHPYTIGLMASIPRHDIPSERLEPIRGAPPDLLRIPPGCPFHPRCPHAKKICFDENPPLEQVDEAHWSACHFREEVRIDR